MRNPFTAHPHEVGETYPEHARFAMRYGTKMTLGGLAALAHGLFPFLFRTTASRITDELAGVLQEARNRGRTAKDETQR
jgi:uncharacterized protein DUF6356